MTHSIPDIQNLDDHRKKNIDQVGVRSIRHRLAFYDHEDDTLHHTIASVGLYVNLTAEKKGTHMSRFIEFLNERLTRLSMTDFPEKLVEMTERLSAETGYIKLSFPFFIDKKAPVSGAIAPIDYDVTLYGRQKNGQIDLQLRLVIPMTTLCPCSKEISDYGAHNQRSYITLTALIDRPISLKRLITAIEKQGSCEVFALLKRPDEKYVTEQAFDNPKFVEDLVRDLARLLDSHEGIVGYRLESENIESIHNHDAYAMIQTAQQFIDIT